MRLLSESQSAVIPILLRVLASTGYENAAMLFERVNDERLFLRRQTEAANEFIDNLHVWMETYGATIPLEAKQDLFQRVELIIALYDEGTYDAEVEE
jgi:hypothetical protein